VRWIAWDFAMQPVRRGAPAGSHVRGTAGRRSKTAVLALALLILQLQSAWYGRCEAAADGGDGQIFWRDFALEDLPSPHAGPVPGAAPGMAGKKGDGGIYVSVVASGRNDNYGGSTFVDRVQPFVSTAIAFACAAFAGRAVPKFELVLVDYNTVQGVPALGDAIRWPFGCREVAVRVASVPARVHQSIYNPNNISFLEHIAKNVGIRAARGSHIVVTNPDVLLSEELYAWLAEERLEHDTFYRIDRHDLGPDFQPPPSSRSGGVGISNTLERSRALLSACLAMFEHVQVSAADGIWDGLMTVPRSVYARRMREAAAADAQVVAVGSTKTSTGGAGVRARALLSESPWPVTQPSRLHTMAAGDFMLMAAREWHALRGYPEVPTNMEVDSHMCVIAAAAGLKQVVLKAPKRIFHQHHSGHLRATRELPERDRSSPPKPHTPHPAPYTLHPTPYTLHPTPYTGPRRC